MANKHLPQFHKYLFIAIVTLLVIVTKSNAYFDDLNKPCKFLDSINITDGSFDEDDDSITHDGIYYPKGYYAEYDYEFVNESYRQSVAQHWRGCTCKLKPCVRMCCPRGQILDRTQCLNDSVYDLPASATNDGISFTRGNIFDLFHYVVGRPCYQISPSEPDIYPEDTWFLFTNGSVLFGNGPSEVLSKNNYCFNPVHINDSIELSLMKCFEPISTISQDTWLPYGLFISVPFLVVTVLVYIILPELRNVHGKSLVCYLLGLIVGYITLGWVKLNGSEYVEPVLCRTLGYVVYSGFISAFFWLNVISFDLWRNFRGWQGITKSADCKKFLVYSTYAWGSTIFMIVLCYFMDFISWMPSKFQPGIGVETCFLKKSRLSEFLYLYLPITLIMCCNCTFFVLTALRLRKVQMEKEDNNKHERHLKKIGNAQLDNEKSQFGLICRLFIVMGITWSMEPISWFISPGSWYFFVTDFVNAFQGVFIFILFVMNQKVKELIIKRWNIWLGRTPPRNQETTVDTVNPIKNNPIAVALISNEKN